MANASDNFSGLGTGNLSGRVSSSGATWSVLSGSFAGDGRSPAGVYAIEGGDNIAVLGTADQADYDVTLAINQLDGSGDDRGLAAIGRCVDGNNYYQLAYQLGNSKLEIVRFSGGSYGILGSAGGGLATGPFTLRMRGNQISGLDQNGNLAVGPFTDGALTAAGSPGIKQYGGATTTNGRHATNITYADPVSAATSYTLTSGSGGAESVGTADTLTLTANGTSTATVTLVKSGLNGTFAPTTVNLNGTTPVTVTFTPSTTGSGTISSTNNGSLANPSALAVTVSPAGSLTAGALTLGAVSSSSVTLTFTQSTGGSAIYTDQLQRSVHGAGAYSSVVGATSSPATDATVTASTSYDYRVAYNDRSSIVYSNVVNAITPAPAGAITFTDPNCSLFGFHGSSASVLSSDPGSYLLVGFNGTSVSVAWNALPSGAGMSYQIDGGPWTDTTASTGFTVSGLGSGNHSLWLIINYLSQTGNDEWNGNPPANAVTLTSITLASGATSTALTGTARPIRPNGTWLIFGDSITRGIAANNGSDSSRMGYSYFLAQALGAEYINVGKGYQGYTANGAPGSNVPTFAGTYPYYYGTTSRPFAGLAGIFVAHGTNDALNNGSASDATISGVVATTINGIRAKLILDGNPNAPLMISVPAGGSNGVQYRKAAITNGFVQSTANPANRLSDPGPELVPGMVSGAFTGDGVHPQFQKMGTPEFADIYGAAIRSAQIAMAAATGSSSTATSYTVVGLPTIPVVGQTYNLGIVLNGPAASNFTATFGAITGITWGGTVSIASGANLGMTTVSFSQIGTFTPTVTHTGGGSGISIDPILSSLTSIASSGTALTQAHFDAVISAGLNLSSTGLDAIQVETGINVRQALSGIFADATGTIVGNGSGVVQVKAPIAGTPTRITATMSNSDRILTTLSLPA